MTATSTCRSRAASSAWSIAKCSTSGCGNVRPPAEPSAATAPSSASLATPTERPWSTIVRRRRKTPQRIRARVVIGADGALSAVARQSIPGADRMPYVFAYHEIIRSPQAAVRCIRRRALRRLLPGHAVARFLRLDFSPRRHHQRRHRQRAQGIFTARRRQRRCATRPASTVSRPSGARARRFRCGRCRAGTTDATSCSPAMRRAWSRRRRAKGSTTP